MEIWRCWEMCGDLEMLVDVWRSGDVEIGEDVER